MPALVVTAMLAAGLGAGPAVAQDAGRAPPDAVAARRKMVAEASQAALAQARAIADTVGQRIARVEPVEVDPPGG